MSDIKDAPIIVAVPQDAFDLWWNSQFWDSGLGGTDADYLRCKTAWKQGCADGMKKAFEAACKAISDQYCDIVRDSIFYYIRRAAAQMGVKLEEKP